MTSRAVRLSYAVVVAFFACLAVAFASLAYASHVQKQAERRAEVARVEADRRWCSLLVNIGNAQRQTPPTTPSGKGFAVEIDRLRRQFGCPVS